MGRQPNASPEPAVLPALHDGYPGNPPKDASRRWLVAVAGPCLNDRPDPRPSVAEPDRVIAKCAWRLIPFMMLLYVVGFIDRSNVGFAALTMNRDLGFSPAIFGLGAGVFFLGFLTFQIPTALLLARLGARRVIFCVMLVWGLVSAGNAFMRDAHGFYALRFLLGVAEGGFTPSMIYYLTLWFPLSYRGRFTALFCTAIPLAGIISGPLSGLLLGMEGIGGLHGWQWLFLAQGLPAMLLAFVV